MNTTAIRTSGAYRADRILLLMGGRIEPVRRTGEKRYIHNLFDRPLRISGRRDDVPSKSQFSPSLCDFPQRRKKAREVGFGGYRPEPASTAQRVPAWHLRRGWSARMRGS